MRKVIQSLLLAGMTISLGAQNVVKIGWFGPETGDYRLYRESNNAGMLPPGRGDFERVAIIGAGVSGLTADRWCAP